MLAVITAIAFIALIVASGIASVRYGWPQVRAWRSAFRRDPSAFDDARSGRPVAMAWSLWAVLGAGAFVGAAEAVAEGGAGTLAWSWLFAVLTSPLCAVAARAARTTSPGNAAPRVAGSLGAYFEQRGGARWHARIAHAGTFAWMFIAAIWAVLLTQRLLEELGVGTRGAAGNVGAMLRDPAWLACAAATLVGATLAMIEGRFVRVIHLVLGALGLLLVVAWMGVLVVGAAGDGAAAFVDAVGDAFRGAAPRGAWTGATAAEVAMSAITWLLPWFVLVIAVGAAMHARGTRSTAVEAGRAALTPFALAGCVTLLGCALVGGGALGVRAPGERALEDVRFARSAFETARERERATTTFRGLARIVDGVSRDPHLVVAASRGVIADPRFETDTSASDAAFEIRGGTVVTLLETQNGALRRTPPSRMSHVTVRGDTVPDGPELLARTTETLAPRFDVRGVAGAWIALLTLALATLARALPFANTHRAVRLAVPGIAMVALGTPLFPWVWASLPLAAIATVMLVAATAIAALRRA